MNQRPDAVASTDRRVEVQFVWNHDRYLQRVYIEGQLAGHSVEGTVDDAWPVSPPLQQISLQQIDGRPAVLGVGSAGRSHWSLSAVACAERASAVCLELACRCAGNPEFLGSTYQLSTRGNIEAIDAVVVRAKDRITIEARTSPSATRRWSYQILAG